MPNYHEFIAKIQQLYPSKLRSFLTAAMIVTLFSQEASALSITETFANTYKQNDSIKAAQQNFLSEIEEFAKALSNGFLPDIDLKVSKTDVRSKQYLEDIAQKSEQGPTTKRALTISQNLFSGGKSVAALKAAQEQFRISRSNLYTAEQKNLTESLKRYLAVCEKRETYRISKETLEFYRKTYEAVNERRKVGEATTTDVAQAKAKLAQGEYEKSKSFAALEGALASFKSWVGLEPDEQIDFPPLPAGIPESLEQYTAKVTAQNYNLTASQNAVAKTATIVKANAAALLPTVSLTASVIDEYPQGPQGTNVHSHEVQTSVVLNVPIFSNGGAEYSNIRRSKKEARKTAYEHTSRLKEQEAQNISLWQTFISLKDALHSAEESLEAAALIVEGTQQEYNVGNKAILDVLNAEKQHQDAKLQLLQVKNQYITLAYQLKAEMGEMTARHLKFPELFSPEKEFKRIKRMIVW